MLSLICQSKDDSKHCDRIPAAQESEWAGNALEEPPGEPAVCLWIQPGQRRTTVRYAFTALWEEENRDQGKSFINLKNPKSPLQE